MIEIVSEKYFHLMNEHSSYLFYIMENQQLGHLYYGKPLGKLTEADLSYLVERTNKSAGTVKYSSENGLFTLADRQQEYPVYGSSDFKTGAIDIFIDETPLYLDFKVKGYDIINEKKRSLDRPRTYGTSEKVETLSILLEDEPHQIALTLNYSIFEDSAAIVQSQRLENLGKTPVKIQKMLSGI